MDLMKLNNQDFFRFAKEFLNESDRAAVILGASMIDEQLYQILKKYFPYVPENKDKLLLNHGALYYMYSRNQMVYRLGFIKRGMYNTIEVIRAIRNAFAHELMECSFKSPQIIKLVDKFPANIKNSVSIKNMMKTLTTQKPSLSGPSLLVRAIISYIIEILQVIQLFIKPLKRENNYPFLRQ